MKSCPADFIKWRQRKHGSELLRNFSDVENASNKVPGIYAEQMKIGVLRSAEKDLKTHGCMYIVVFARASCMDSLVAGWFPSLVNVAEKGGGRLLAFSIKEHSRIHCKVFLLQRNDCHLDQRRYLCFSTAALLWADG